MENWVGGRLPLEMYGDLGRGMTALEMYGELDMGATATKNVWRVG